MLKWVVVNVFKLGKSLGKELLEDVGIQAACSSKIKSSSSNH